MLPPGLVQYYSQHSCDSTTVRLNYLNSKIFGEQGRWELHKHAEYFFKQILEAVLYSCNINISRNIIKHNLQTSMNDWTHFFIKIYISHTLFSKGLIFLWCVRDGWRDINSERGLLPISSSSNLGVPTLAPPCKLIRDTCPLLDCDYLHCLNLTMWFSSRLHTCVTACQTHEVTRNELKIHGICYITHHTIKVKQAWYTRYCWSSKDELISDILLWTTTHGHTSIGWPVKTYIHQLLFRFCVQSRKLAKSDGQ